MYIDIYIYVYRYVVCISYAEKWMLFRVAVPICTYYESNDSKESCIHTYIYIFIQ